MRTAQEQALLVLACGRGLLTPAARARLEAQSGQAHLAQHLVQERLVPPEQVSALLRELTLGVWRCPTCPQVRAGWADLGRISRLSCPACQGPLVSQGAMASGSALLGTRAPSPSSSAVQPDPQGETRRGRPGATGALPRRVGPYRLESLLGKGSCARVYLARRDDVAREFALKVIEDPDPDDAELLLRWRREVEVASRIRHPGVVPILHAGEDHGIHYYAMDYCPGSTLKELLRERQRLEPREAAGLIAQVARAAHAAHEAGVIHRDLKPANIIIDQATGQPRITDFGMARDEQALRSMTETGDVLGTPYYMAPEQFRGERDLDHRIDIYALGVMLYELLCGQRPYDAGTALALKRRIERGDPPPLRELAPATSPRLERVCLRAMAVDREDRPASAAELAHELEQLAAPEPEPARARSSSRGLLIGVGLGALLGAAGATAAVLVVLRQGRTESPVAPVVPATDPAQEVGRRLAQATRLAAEQARLDAPPPWPRVEEAYAAAHQAAGSDQELRARVDLQRAGHELRRGRWGEALRLAQGAGSPGRPICAQALERLGRREAARRAWQELADDAEAPGQLVARAALGRLGGARARAETAARAAVERAGPVGEIAAAAWLELARALLSRHDARQAEPALDALLRLCPDDPWEPLLRARLALQREDATAAVAQLRRAELLGAAEDPERLALEARLALTRADLDGAAALLERALAADPRHLPSLVHRVVLNARRAPQDRTGRLSAWQAACDVDELAARAVMLEAWPKQLVEVEGLQPTRWEAGAARALRWIGLVSDGVAPAARTSLTELHGSLVKGAPWKDVADVASAAWSAAPGDPGLRRELARALIGRARGGEALQHLTPLPADAERERLRGEALWQSGRPGAALEALRAAQALDPQGGEGLTAQAEALWLERREADALAAADRALEQEPEHYPALVVRALVLASREGTPTKELLTAIKSAHAWRGFQDARLLAVTRLAKDHEQEDLGALQASLQQTMRLMFGVEPPSPAAPTPVPKPEEDLERLWEQNRAAFLRLLLRDAAHRRRRPLSGPEALGGPGEGAYARVIGGRELLRRRATRREEVRERWLEARALDPQLQICAGDLAEVKERWPQTDPERFLAGE